MVFRQIRDRLLAQEYSRHVSRGFLENEEALEISRETRITDFLHSWNWSAGETNMAKNPSSGLAAAFLSSDGGC
jgi:hypothetical protein